MTESASAGPATGGAIRSWLALAATVAALVGVAIVELRNIQRLRDALASGLSEADTAYRLAIIASVASALLGVALAATAAVLFRRYARNRQQAFDALHAQRERLRATLVSIGDAVIVTDLAGRITLLNPVAEKLTGWPLAEAKGQPLGKVFRIIGETSREPVSSPAEKALHEGAIVGLANHTVLIARDGSELPIDDSAAPLRDSSGRVAGAVLVFRDIAERRTAELSQAERGRLTALRADVGFSLATGDGERGVLQSCAAALVRHLDVTFARIWTVDEAGDTLLLQASAGLYTHIDGAHSRVPVGAFKIGRIAARARPHLTNDLANDEEVSDQAWARRVGLVAFAGYPLIAESRVVGVMALFARTPLPETVLAELAPLADGIGQYVRRREVERDLRATEGRNHTILESITDGFYTVDPDWHITHLNGHAQAYFGKTAHELLGQVLWDVVPSLRNSVFHERYEQAVREGQTAEFEAWSPFSHKWIEIRAYPSAEGLSVYFRDVTERQRADAALRASEGRLQLLDDLGQATRGQADPLAIMAVTTRLLGQHLRATRCAYADVHPDGDHFTIRSDWTEGVSSTVGDYRLDLFGPRAAADQRAGRTLVVCNVDAELSPSEGGDMFRAIAIRAIVCCPLVKGGRLVAMMAVHHAEPRDWTADEVLLVEAVVERSWAHIERARTEEALRDADRRKDEFLATLAHELRNPLAPIRTGLQVIEMDPAGVEGRKAVTMMERQLAHMVRLVDDLMDISRVSRGRVDLKKSPVAVRGVVESAVDSSRPGIEAGHHELTLSLSDEELWVEGDRDRLVQVVANLLNNAAKYTPEGGRISLAVRRDGEAAILSVTDTGVGIPADMLGRVFELFTQVGRSLDRAQGGLGIGLSLVQRLVELHGGTVTATSAGPDLGSTFTVRLPLTTARVESSTGENSGNGTAYRGLRVLVVDDNADGAATLAMLLRAYGHAPQIAPDGLAGLALAREQRPEIAFLDIGLPGLNGYELAQAIRRDETIGHPVLVALTGWGGEEDRRRSAEAGFDHHLTKPASPTEVAELLGRVATRPGAGPSAS